MYETVGLKPYQEEAKAAIVQAWREGASHVQVVMATGSGKGSVQLSLIDTLLNKVERVLLVARNQEHAVNLLELAGLAMPNRPALLLVKAADMPRSDSSSIIITTEAFLSSIHLRGCRTFSLKISQYLVTIKANCSINTPVPC